MGSWDVAKVIRDAFNTAGVNPDTKESTQLIRKPAARRESTHNSSRNVSAAAMTLESNYNNEQELSDFIDGFMKNKNSVEDLLKLYGLNEVKIREILQPAARLFLQINYFLKTGRILKDEKSAMVINLPL